MNWDEAHLQGDLEAMQQAREEAIVRAALERAADACEQMAARIEELEAKLRAVIAARELMGNMWANAQDKLGKALEALETIAYESVDDEGIYTARTTLAELKGEDRG